MDTWLYVHLDIVWNTGTGRLNFNTAKYIKERCTFITYKAIWQLITTITCKFIVLLTNYFYIYCIYLVSFRTKDELRLENKTKEKLIVL